MKIYKVSETAAETAEYPTSEDTLYSTYEVAKKHFDEKRASVLGDEVFAKHINCDKEDSLEYSDGYKWWYGLYIEEVEVLDE